MVSTNSANIAAPRPYLPGECSAKPLAAKPLARVNPIRPLAIGLALVMIHLVSIPVTNTSVNPARSTGPALFVGGWALAQLWLFWIAPLIGGALGGVIYRWLSDEPAGVVEGLKTA